MVRQRSHGGFSVLKPGTRMQWAARGESMTTPITPRRSASQRAQRALARAAGDRRLLAGAAATAGAALAAGVARELLSRDDGDAGGDPSRAYRIKRSETAADAVRRIITRPLDDPLGQPGERPDEGGARPHPPGREGPEKGRGGARPG